MAPADSPLLRELRKAGPAVWGLAARLGLASRRPLAAPPWLDEVAPDGEPDPLDPAVEPCDHRGARRMRWSARLRNDHHSGRAIAAEL